MGNILIFMCRYIVELRLVYVCVCVSVCVVSVCVCVCVCVCVQNGIDKSLDQCRASSQFQGICIN